MGFPCCNVVLQGHSVWECETVLCAFTVDELNTQKAMSHSKHFTGRSNSGSEEPMIAAMVRSHILAQNISLAAGTAPKSVTDLGAVT